MTDLDFFSFLERALQGLTSEVPAASAELARVLRGVALQLHVDGEARALLAHGEHCSLQHDISRCVAELRTQRKVLVALLEAEQTLMDAVTRDELLLRGSPSHLASIYEALVVFVQGAIRSTSIPKLLDHYLTAASK